MEELYEEFCRKNIGKCVREVENTIGMDVVAIARCLEKKMRQEFGSAYDDQTGYEVAKKESCNYY